MVVLETASSGLLGGWLEAFRGAVEAAAGWEMVVIIAVYSFLIAFVLPFPSEVVLAGTLGPGIPRWFDLVVIIVVSGLAKAAGSVVAYRVGHTAKQSGPVLRAIERAGVDVREWSRRQTVRLAKRYGYAGLAIALSVPFFPDTFSIYAFSVLSEDYPKFALATFVGSAGRLIVTLLFVRGTLVVV